MTDLTSLVELKERPEIQGFHPGDSVRVSVKVGEGNTGCVRSSLQQEEMQIKTGSGVSTKDIQST